MIGTHEVFVYANRDAPTGDLVDLSCLADEVAITHGRADTTEQPEPAAARVNITVGPGAPLDPAVDMGAWLVVQTTVAGQTFRRFTGRITDVAVGWDDAGEGTPESGVGQVVAVSVLGDYARRVIGDEPFPEELDGARVARVFALAGLVLDPATSDPGTVPLNPRDVDARAALEVATNAATSAGGLVWETRAGDIRYADADHRRGADVTVDLDACDVLVTPTWSRNLSGLVNELSVAYGLAPDGGGEQPQIHETNPESVARYGRYNYSVSTDLATFDAAQSWAWLVLTQNRGPVWMLQALPVDLAGLDAAHTTALLGAEVHTLARVSGLPATGATPTSIAAWIEGWTERLAWGVHDLELSVSDYCRTVPGIRWDDTPADVTWDTYGTASWDESACAGGPLPDLGRWDDVAATTRWDAVPSATTWDNVDGGVLG